MPCPQDLKGMRHSMITLHCTYSFFSYKSLLENVGMVFLCYQYDGVKALSKSIVWICQTNLLYIQPVSFSYYYSSKFFFMEIFCFRELLSLPQ